MNTSDKLPKFLQIISGNKDWILPKQRGLSFGCCECGLAHRINFRVIKLTETLKGYKKEVMSKQYQVEFQLMENKYMTNKIRKKEYKTYLLNE